jgi:DNA-binding IclR family transcriptional regulator
LLQCFETAGETRSLASLAQQSGFYKSTVLRLAGSLCRKGFLQRDEKGFFTLGPELRRLGSLTHSSVEVEKLMRPVLRNLLQAGDSSYRSATSPISELRVVKPCHRDAGAA